jgi:hypothetical protein
MQWQPFIIEIEGLLPELGVGDFWELDVRLVGSKLVMDDARLILKFPKRREENFVSAENHIIPGLLKETNGQTPTQGNQKTMTAVP